jgi:isochorismate hydrolase
MRIPAQFHFPENEAFEGKKYNFNYTDNNKLNVVLSIDVETYFPSFEQTSKRKSSNVMERIELRKTIKTEGSDLLISTTKPFFDNPETYDQYLNRPRTDPENDVFTNTGTWVDNGRLEDDDIWVDA